MPEPKSAASPLQGAEATDAASRGATAGIASAWRRPGDEADDPPDDADAGRLKLGPFSSGPAAGRWRTEMMHGEAGPLLLFVTRGQGRITIAGLTSGYGPNNLILIPPRTMYAHDAGPLVQGHRLSIPASLAARWPDEIVHLRLRDVTSQKEIVGHFDSLERELKSHLVGHDRAAACHAELLCVALERQMTARAAGPEGVDDPRRRSAAARLVAAYTDMIERNFWRSYGVADYASALGVTPTHLSRCCRQTCDRAALSLLNERIMYEARVMLRDGDLPMQDIAQALGFASAAYFTRAFQASAGMTPTAFRRQTVAPRI